MAARTQAVYASEDAADGGAHDGNSGGGTAGNIAKPGEEKEAPASEQPQQPPEQAQNPEEPKPPASRTRSSYWLFQPIYTKVCSPSHRISCAPHVALSTQVSDGARTCVYICGCSVQETGRSNAECHAVAAAGVCGEDCAATPAPTECAHSARQCCDALPSYLHHCLASWRRLTVSVTPRRMHGLQRDVHFEYVWKECYMQYNADPREAGSGGRQHHEDCVRPRHTVSFGSFGFEACRHADMAPALVNAVWHTYACACDGVSADIHDALWPMAVANVLRVEGDDAMHPPSAPTLRQVRPQHGREAVAAAHPVPGDHRRCAIVSVQHSR